ncbi:MAG: hypothetical protein ACKOWF_07965 [Chloroflexota bacterium]
MSGVAAIIGPGMLRAGKTIAGAIVDLRERPGERARARAGFAERTGGGAGGSPLLAARFFPSIDLSWPERIAITRGVDRATPEQVP